MERTYDILEILSDGHLVWRGAVAGHEAALDRMRQLASKSSNEFRMMHLPSDSVAAILNAKDARSATDKQDTQAERRDDDTLLSHTAPWLHSGNTPQTTATP